MNQKTAESFLSSRMNEFDNKLQRAHNLHNRERREEIFLYFHHRL